MCFLGSQRLQAVSPGSLEGFQRSRSMFHHRLISTSSTSTSSFSNMRRVCFIVGPFALKIRSSSSLTDNHLELKSTRLLYKLKQHKAIKEYLLRLFQDISDDPYTLKCVVHAFPPLRLTNLCLIPERVHMPRSEAGHRRNRNQR